jgi:hypothetical protein
MTAKCDSTLFRFCKGCEKNLPANTDVFPPHKLGKYGLYTHCRACNKVRTADLRARPDQKARQKAWRDANKEIVKDSNKAYRLSGYSSTEHVAAWRAKNLDHAREKESARARIRRAEDPVFAMMHRVRVSLNRHIFTGGYTKKSKSTDVLGCDWEFLKKHIERQFLQGMTWDNKGEWELDHIVPLSSARTPEEVLALGHHTNIRPLWRTMNRQKSNTMTHLI